MKDVEEELAVADALNRGRGLAAPDSTPRWVVLFGLVAAAIFLAFIVIHLTGRGLGHHGAGSEAPARTELGRGREP